MQAESADAEVRAAYYDTGAGAFEVPARTTAVFLVQRAIGDQIDLLMDEVDTLETAGVVNGGQANSLTAKLKAAQKSAANGRSGPAANQIRAFINHVQAFVAAGVLSPEEGELLISIAEEILLSLG